MHEAILKSGRDALFVAVPLLIILFMGFFRFDELLVRSPVARSRRARNLRTGSPHAFASDPDGTPLLPAQHSRLNPPLK